MDEDTKREIEKLFATDKQRIAERDTAQEERKGREAKFVSDFEKAVADIVEPAMQEIAGFVTTKGWQCHLDKGNEPQAPRAPFVRLSFFRGERRENKEGRYPYFSVVCEKTTQRIVFLGSTIGPSHGGGSGPAGASSLDNLSIALIQQKLTEYLTKLMDARPY